MMGACHIYERAVYEGSVEVTSRSMAVTGMEKVR